MMDKPKKKSDESPLAILGTMALVVPVLVLCCAGPALVASFLVGIGAWLDQRSPMEIAAAALATGVIVLGIVRWRRRRHMQIDRPGCGCSPSGQSEDNRSHAHAAGPS